jgi:hypothetical protein
MWRRKGEKKDQKKDQVKEEKKEEKETSLLEELCRGDTELHDCLSGYLFLNPTGAISKKDINTLTEEGEKNGDFRPAMDKAIFEGSQNPEEKGKYIQIIQNLTTKTITATEQRMEKAEKEGLTDQAASLKRVINNQKFMHDRAGDIIDTASKYYKEVMIEQGEQVKREDRAARRTTAQAEEWRAEQEERERREAAKKERKALGREERSEAEKQEVKEELAAEERKEAREQERIKAEKEEEIIDEREKEEREARKKGRMGN